MPNYIRRLHVKGDSIEYLANTFKTTIEHIEEILRN